MSVFGTLGRLADGYLEKRKLDPEALIALGAHLSESEVRRFVRKLSKKDRRTLYGLSRLATRVLEDESEEGFE